MNFAAVLMIVWCSVTAAHGYRMMMANPHVRHCQAITVPYCSGTGFDFGYTMTSLSPSEQSSRGQTIMAALMATGPTDSPQALPFLCYALIPKCERETDYDIKPCVEACQSFKAASSPEMKAALADASNDLSCDSTNFKSSDSGDTCLSYQELFQTLMSVADYESEMGSNPDSYDIGMSGYQGADLSGMSLDQVNNITDQLTNILSNMNGAMGTDGTVDLSALSDHMSQLTDLAQSLGIEMPEGYDPTMLENLKGLGTMDIGGMDMGGMGMGNTDYSSMYNTDFGGDLKKK